MSKAIEVLIETFRDSLHRGKQPTFSAGDLKYFINALFDVIDKECVHEFVPFLPNCTKCDEPFETKVHDRKPFGWWRVPKDFPLQGSFFSYIEGQSEIDFRNSLDSEFGFYVKWLYDVPRLEDTPAAWVTLQPDWDDEDRTAITNPESAEEYDRTCYTLTPLYKAKDQ